MEKIINKVFKGVQSFIYKKTGAKIVGVRWGNTITALIALSIFMYGAFELISNTAQAISSKYTELEGELTQIAQEESQKRFDENYQVIEVVVNEDADLQKLQEEYLEQEVLYHMISKTLELNPHISNYYVPQGTVVSLISKR